MEKEKFLEAVQFILDNANLTGEDKVILKGYFAGVPDAQMAKIIKVKTKERVRGKRQNICAKLGSVVIRNNRLIVKDLHKFS